MKKKNFAAKLLELKPPVLIWAGLALSVVVGGLGEYCSWGRIPWTPFSNVLGGLVWVSGWLFHRYCHRFHSRAHERATKIQAIVTTGPFARIRHPMYLSLILMDGGLTLAWGIGWMFVPFLLFLGFIIVLLIQEENLLLQTAGPQYRNYMRRVRWRLVPGIF